MSFDNNSLELKWNTRIFYCLFSSLLHVCFILIFRWLPGKLIPNWAQKMKLCATVKARTLVHLYLHPENEGKFLSERECIECNLPEISKKGNDVEMSIHNYVCIHWENFQRNNKTNFNEGQKILHGFQRKKFWRDSLVIIFV